MKPFLQCVQCFGLWLLLLASHALGQVPERLLVQGNVYANNRPFSGTGEFKFALVDATGTTSFWSNDGSSTGGAEPGKSVKIPVAAGAYSVVLGDPSLPGMLPLPSAAFTNAGVQLRTWFSDGVQPFSHLAPDEPFVPVGYAMMSARVAPGAVGPAELAPAAVTRQALAPGAVGPEHLAPGAAVANLRAAGGLVVSSQSEDAALVDAGFSRLAEMPVEGETWRRHDFNLPPARQGHTALWTGKEMIVLGLPNSGSSPSQSLSGFLFNPDLGTWSALPKTNAPQFVTAQTSTGSAVWRALWTGADLLVWNGQRNGVRCDPHGEAWQKMSALGSPSPRFGYSAVWTGKDWILWGGSALTDGTLHKDGARYEAAKDMWFPISSANGPSARTGHLAFWTGKEMIVVGGNDTSGRSSGIWSYNPELESWTQLSTASAPTQFDVRSGALLGDQLVLFPVSLGQDSSPFPAGARFDLTTRRWTRINPTGAPTGAQGFTTSVTDQEILLWGGYLARLGTPILFQTVNQGFAYDPARDSWRELSSVGAPSPRQQHTAVWTGKDLIIWGGAEAMGNTLELADGGRYRPADDRWFPFASAALNRNGPRVAWMDHELFVWGGTNPIPNRVIAGGGVWNPTANSWRSLPARNTPAPRLSPTAVWTGHEVFVWGGFTPLEASLGGQGYAGSRSGAAYVPADHRWTPLPEDSAIPARGNHSAIWTGSEMIVWGGTATMFQNGALNSGGRFNPKTGAWTPTSQRLPADTLPGRTGHAAFWTGQEMLVWGGFPNPVEGLRYDPAADRWSKFSPGPYPTSGVTASPAVWLGNQLLAGWGGVRWALYDPATDTWRKVAATSAPAAAWDTSLVWTGRDVLALGNLSSLAHRYRPETDTWTKLSTAGRPVLRTGYTTAWTGSTLYFVGGPPGLQGNGETLPQTMWELSLTRPVYLYGPR